jgi:predicted outer membrane protein
MSKLILTGLCAVAALGLAACGTKEENNVAVENMEDLNATSEEAANMDMNMNMDVNATENATDNMTNTETGNEATNNSY